MLFLFFCMMLPCAAMVFGIATGRIGGGESIFAKAKIAVMAFMAVATLTSIIIFMNRRQKARGDYFTFDKTRKQLRLCRFDVELGPAQIQSFFSFQAGYEYHGHTGRARELTVITKTDSGEFIRYPVVKAEYAKQVEQIGKKLADLLSVPIQSVKLKKTIKIASLEQKSNNEQ